MAMADFVDALVDIQGSRRETSIGTKIIGGLLGYEASFVGFVQSEVVLVVCVSILLWALRHLVEEQLESSMRLRGLQDHTLAMSSVLSQLCDAVVHLNSELQITQPSPKLAALLNHSTIREERCDFLNLVAGRDKVRFKSSMQSNSTEECLEERIGQPQEMLHVHLRDAFGIVVPCQIFHTRFHDLGGLDCYVLGINEMGERDRGCDAKLAPHIQEQLHAPQEDVGQLFNPDYAVNRVAGEKGTPSGSAASSCSDRLNDALGVGDLIWQVDFHASTVEVVSASPAFQIAMGMGKTALQRAFEHPPVYESFKTWLAAQRCTPCVEDFGPAVLRFSRGSQQRPRRRSVTLQVYFPERRGAAEQEDCVSCRIAAMGTGCPNPGTSEPTAPRQSGQPHSDAEPLPHPELAVVLGSRMQHL